jgi:uncharacterized damage-inducible protein DinB
MRTPAERAALMEHYARADDLLRAALPRFPRQMWHHRPAPDRWTVHEILIHIADSEANSYARARRIIAEPGQTVMAYDEMAWARRLDYHAQSPETALELFRWLRRATAELIRAQPEAVWAHTTRHPENGEMTLDDWLEVYARHVPEHLEQMEAVLADWAADGRA